DSGGGRTGSNGKGGGVVSLQGVGADARPRSPRFACPWHVPNPRERCKRYYRQGDQSRGRYRVDRGGDHVPGAWRWTDSHLCVFCRFRPRHRHGLVRRSEAGRGEPTATLGGPFDSATCTRRMQYTSRFRGRLKRLSGWKIQGDRQTAAAQKEKPMVKKTVWMLFVVIVVGPVPSAVRAQGPAGANPGLGRPALPPAVPGVRDPEKRRNDHDAWTNIHSVPPG